MSLKELRDVVIKETKNLPDNYRCHEAARKIGNKLRLLGINVDIKDGIVVYDTHSLLRNFLASMDFSHGLPKKVKREMIGKGVKRKLRVFHSWCEVTENKNNVIVVDWHARLKISRDQTLEGILIVEKKKNLPHSYNPIGITLGRRIVFKGFPLHATRLRL